MAIISYIPKCTLEEEQIVALRDMGVHFEEGKLPFGNVKVNCLKVYNLTETQVWDKLDSRRLVESTDAQKGSYANRAVTVIFMQLQRVRQIKDKDLRTAAAASLLAGINSLAALDVSIANRFLSLVRAIN